MTTSELSNVLLELRNASLGCPKTDTSINELFTKYDMLFLGSRLNTINTIELLHTLKIYFKLSLTSEELLSLIPETCDRIGMKYDPLIIASVLSSEKNAISAYNIYLH